MKHSLNIPAGPFDGYIFDCDGTLAHSMKLHFEAWQYSFKKHNAKFEFTWELFRSMGGMGLIHTVESLNEIFADYLNAEVVVRDQEAYVDQHIMKIKPNEEVVAIAREVAKTHPVSVASGGHEHHVMVTLEAIGVKDLFDIVVTQNDVSKSKPAPDLFLLAAQRMEVDPLKCLVFEDAPLGIQAATNAGMQSVLVTDV